MVGDAPARGGLPGPDRHVPGRNLLRLGITGLSALGLCLLGLEALAEPPPAQPPQSVPLRAENIRLPGLPLPEGSGLRAQGIQLTGQAGEAPLFLIRSARMGLEPGAGVAWFEGDVVLEQGALRLQCRRLSARFDPGSREIQRALAEGDVRLSWGEWRGQAERAELLPGTQLLTLTGRAEVQQADSRLTGEVLRWRLTDGALECEGCSMRWRAAGAR